MSVYVEESSPFDPNTLFDDFSWYLQQYSSALYKLGLSGDSHTTYIEADISHTSKTSAFASFSVSFIYHEDVPIECMIYVDDVPLQTVDPATFEFIDRVDTATNNYAFSEQIEFSTLGSHYVHCAVTVFGSTYTSPKLELKVVEDITHETPTISTVGADAVYRLDAEEVTELKASAFVGDGGFVYGAWYQKSQKAGYGDKLVTEQTLGGGAVSASFTPPIDEPGTYEYYFRATNHSPIDDLDSYDEAKSETITITILPAFDRPSFQLGIAVGLGLKGFGYVHEGKREPIAYLYNGVRLPKLPEWDRERYPFALMCYQYDKYFLYCMDSERKVTKAINGTGSITIATITGPVFVSDGGEWEESTLGALAAKTVWANYDVYFHDSSGGGLCLSASNPVPVYE